ncbi:MAG TPA: reverse transcriptase domain-containing protein [Candidatus Tectomicrobia bacterium]
MVEADSPGFFAHMDHDGLLKRLRWRIDDRAVLGLIRQWLHAGILEPDGRGIHPDTGTPQGGVVAPVLAHGSLHEAWDRWVAKVVNPRCRGEAVIRRYADDLGWAVRCRSEAEWCYQALPQRLGNFTLAVAPEKTRLLRCSRLPPGLTRRCTVGGVEVFWAEDRPGVPRVTRRTARKTLQRACTRIKAWMQANRHVPGNAFFNGLTARLRGHDHDDGVQGHSKALHRVFAWAMPCGLTWLNRRGGNRRSFSWKRFTQRLDAVPRARPRLTEQSRRRG